MWGWRLRWGCSVPICHQVRALDLGWAWLVMVQRTRGFGLCPNFPGLWWSIGHRAGSWALADPRMGHLALWVSTLLPIAGTKPMA